MGMKLDLSYLENINSAFRGQIVAYIFHDVSKFNMYRNIKNISFLETDKIYIYIPS